MRLLMVGMLLCAGAWAESKAEKALREKLAAVQAQLDSAVQDRKTLADALAISSRSAATGRAAASGAAVLNAQKTKDSVEAVGTRVDAVKTRVDESQESSDKGYRTMMWTMVTAAVTTILGFLRLEYTARRDRRWAKEDAAGLAKETKKHREDVLEKLDGVGDKADAAYKESNNVNVKLATIGVQIADGKQGKKRRVPAGSAEHESGKSLVGLTIPAKTADATGGAA